MKNNKFYALLSAIIMCCVVTAKADIISLTPSAAYLKTNYSLASGDGSIVSNNGGYQVGVDLSVDLMIVSVTPGILYSNSSFTLQNSVTEGVACEVRARNLSLPVIVALNILGPLKLEAGPVFTIQESNRMAETKDFTLRRKESYLVGIRASMIGLSVYARYNFQLGSSEGYLGDIGYNSVAIGAGFSF